VAARQKIYTLTAQNAAMVYRLHIDDAIRTEIQNALNAGRTVTVHEAPIAVSGWAGTGYIIDDPATGAGAYKISGGANGGALVFPGMMLGFLSILAVLFISTPWLALIAGIAGFIANVLLTKALGDDLIIKANYLAARYITMIAGFALFVILDQIIFISLSPIFVAGILWLALSLMTTIVMTLIDTFAENLNEFRKKALIA
jgi:hypothetical protein